MAKASDFIIAVDDGHGSATPGKRTPYIAALGRQVRENEFNKPVANFLEAELKRCGFRTIQLAPTDYDTPLKQRTDTANRAKADALVSVHFNALDGNFNAPTPQGFSAHIHPGSVSGRKLANAILRHLAQGTTQKNRGVVEQNLHMTRESNMPAVLVEFGFMDYEREALLMLNEAFQRECAREVAKGICDYFGVPYVAESSKPASKPEVTKPQPKPVTKPNASGFSDISDDHRFVDAIKFMRDNGYINGYPDGTFRSDEALTRGQFAQVMYAILSKL